MLSLRERQKLRRRDRIFRTAINLFREKGFHQTTATDIAKASHVSRGTFFNYYAYKEAVLLDFGAQLLGEMREQAMAELRRGEPPLEVLHRLWERLAEVSERERSLLSPLAYELLNPDPSRAKAAFEALPLGDLIADILRPLRAEGKLRKDMSLERISRSIADVYLLSALRWAAYTPERELKDEMNKFLSLMLEGALAREAPHREEVGRP
ncbi:putative HTH-type transcriptional regulator YvdT [Meiothermus luteus]|jgi:AcrR family transcriptional regulator|uniref:Putative HTH-type transcriptional regulator YvdT n=1 Tax=Meiothermus luteus TaxID=2026184 RepID=A0A399EHT8_9DEIN|nr:TetR/AcrR family transcriptional regulator [Meiothermus luteus]RIH81882.1 putative HTH-type transcriptional regulator YvdT [Meiothermus luteus]RMH58429.1 MAG: TetR family transcriptional regulator [Deinococcota bacterium]